MEAFQKIQRYGREYQDAMLLAADRKERILSLVAAARNEGYAMESIANAAGLSRQTLYDHRT